MKGKIVKVSGPLIVAENMQDVKMYDVVRVSERRLIGEVIELRGDRASIQVYEETSMLGPGEEVVSTNAPLSVELAPGLIEGIFDGIQRPLNQLVKKSGDRIGRGIEVSAVSHTKKWNFVPKVKPGDKVVAGDIIGTVRENEVIEHRIMIPFGMSGKITAVYEGEKTVDDIVAALEDSEGNSHFVTMLQKWPVRKGRPYREKTDRKSVV